MKVPLMILGGCKLLLKLSYNLAYMHNFLNLGSILHSS